MFEMYRAIFWTIEFLAVALACLPVLLFLFNGWHIRRQEFLNKFTDKAYLIYIKRFWHDQNTSSDTLQSIFESVVFDAILGRRLYIIPFALLFLIISVASELVIQTAIRQGIEHYFSFYGSWQSSLGAHPNVDQIDRIFYPFPSIVLDLLPLAALSGAFLYVAGAVIQASRARTLVTSDLCWSSVRMVIAIPMGLSIAQLANSAVGAFVAFGLGAFPIDAITRLIRRSTNRALNQAEEKAEEEGSDQLVQLVGVTPQIAGSLSSEGVESIQQLADIDPVSLALRMGMPFDYVLSLVSQAQAWCYLGPTAKKLQGLGLGDARPIAMLVEKFEKTPTDEDTQQVFDSAVETTGLGEAVLRFMFYNIYKDEYTGFLLNMSITAAH